MRDRVLKTITSVFVSGTKIYARTEDVASSSTFDSETGVKTSGDLDLLPEEILYLAWQQKQPPSLTERRLRELWAEKRRS